MTKFHLTENRFFEDSRYPYPPYTFDEIILKIARDGLNTLEIVPRYIDEWHEPSAFFVSLLTPSWYRPSRFYDIPTSCYLVQQDTQPAELAELLANMQAKFNCRLSRLTLPADKAVSVAQVSRILELTDAKFPGFVAPNKMSGEMQLHDLHRIVSRDDTIAIEYFTEAGEPIDHVIHETFHQLMFENTNVFADLVSDGYPIGFSIQRPLGTAGITLPPSFSLESAADDAWDVYLVEDDHDRVALIQQLLEKDCKEQQSVQVATRFPLPVSKYRLSRASTEKLEFEEPYAEYQASDLVGSTNNSGL